MNKAKEQQPIVERVLEEVRNYTSSGQHLVMSTYQKPSTSDLLAAAQSYINLAQEQIKLRDMVEVNERKLHPMQDTPVGGTDYGYNLLSHHWDRPHDFPDNFDLLWTPNYPAGNLKQAAALLVRALAHQDAEDRELFNVKPVPDKKPNKDFATYWNSMLGADTSVTLATYPMSTTVQINAGQTNQVPLNAQYAGNMNGTSAFAQLSGPVCNVP